MVKVADIVSRNVLCAEWSEAKIGGSAVSETLQLSDARRGSWNNLASTQSFITRDILTGLVQLLGEVDARAIRVHLAETVGLALSGDSVIVETLSSCRITVVKSAIDVVITVDTGVLARWSIGCQYALSFCAKIVGSTIRAIAIVINCNSLAASTHKVTDRCLAFAGEILRNSPRSALTVGRARSRTEFRHQESELATKARIATILCAVLLIVTEDVLDCTIRKAVRDWNTFSSLAQVGGEAVLLAN